MNQKLKLAGAALAGIVATVAAGGIAMASMDHGLGRMGRADINNDGQITRAEWVQAATVRFDRLDANKDGKLVADEMPRGHGYGHGHRGRHGGGPDRDEGGAAPQQPAQQPVAPPSPTPQK